MRNSADLVLLVSPSGSISGCSAAACRFLGYASKELTDLGVSDVTSSLVSDRVLSLFDGGPQAKEQPPLRVQFRGKSGQFLAGDVTLSRFTDGGEPGVMLVGRMPAGLGQGRGQGRSQGLRHQVLLESVLNSADNAILVLDPDRRMVYYNSKFRELYPFESSYLQQQPTIDDLIRKACEIGIYPREQADDLVARRLAHLEQERSRNVIETPRLDGIVVEGFSAKLPDGGYLLTFRDTTDRCRAELALRHSEERFRSIFESAAVGMLTLSPEGHIWQSNAALCRFLGYNQGELTRLCVADITHPEDRGLTRSLVEEAVQGRRTVVDTEKRYLCKDGTVVWGRVTANWVYGNGGEPLYSVALIQDITEHKRAEASLMQSEERFRSTVNETPLGMHFYELEEHGSLVFTGANPAADTILGISHDALIGKTIEEIFPGLVDAGITDAYRQVCRTGEAMDVYELNSRDGSIEGVFEVRAFRTGPGRLASIFMDITERKLAMEMLRESDRMKSEFISTAAHELRTPLTAIVGFSQVLLTAENLEETEKKEFLTYIHERGMALADIVSDLLDIARIESGQGLPLKLEPYGSLDLIAQINQLVPGFGDEHRFDILLEDLPGSLMVDGRRMTQVLENLLSNAVKYSTGGGTIGIEGKVAEGEYRFAVIDRGIGMNPEQVARMFDKFYRADATDTALEGIGLGMSIVKYIIEGHGGRIWVESAPQQGTSVYFTLPLDTAVAGREAV